MDKDRAPRDGTAGRAGKPDPRRGGGLRALATTLPKVTRRAIGRAGFAEAGLIAEWDTIAGAEIAHRCQPRKLDRPSRRGEGVLTLRVDPGFALELQHLAPLLIERVNGYYGYRAVDRLRLLQAPAQVRAPPAAPPPRRLGDEEESDLLRRLSAVEDEDLRRALARLCRAVGRRPS